MSSIQLDMQIKKLAKNLQVWLIRIRTISITEKIVFHSKFVFLKE
jgi:hypothetical protein